MPSELYGKSAANHAYHSGKHGLGVGARTVMHYTESAFKTMFKYKRIYRYKNGRTAYQDASGLVTIVDRNGKLVSHFMPDKPNQYWQNNILKR